MFNNVLRGPGLGKKLLGLAQTLECGRRAWFESGPITHAKGPSFQHRGVFGSADHESDGIFCPRDPQGVNLSKKFQIFKKISNFHKKPKFSKKQLYFQKNPKLLKKS